MAFDPATQEWRGNIRAFRVRLRGQFYSGGLYNAKGQEMHDLQAAADLAEDMYGEDWAEVYNGEEAIERDEWLALA